MGEDRGCFLSGASCGSLRQACVVPETAGKWETQGWMGWLCLVLSMPLGSLLSKRHLVPSQPLLFLHRQEALVFTAIGK